MAASYQGFILEVTTLLSVKLPQRASSLAIGPMMRATFSTIANAYLRPQSVEKKKSL